MTGSADGAAPGSADIAWFRGGGERPVNGSGNTVFVRPDEEGCDDQEAADDRS